MALAQEAAMRETVENCCPAGPVPAAPGQYDRFLSVTGSCFSNGLYSSIPEDPHRLYPQKKANMTAFHDVHP